LVHSDVKKGKSESSTDLKHRRCPWRNPCFRRSICERYVLHMSNFVHAAASRGTRVYISSLPVIHPASLFSHKTPTILQLNEDATPNRPGFVVKARDSINSSTLFLITLPQDSNQHQQNNQNQKPISKPGTRHSHIHNAPSHSPLGRIQKHHE
jgi:hypothetical protein